MKSQLHWKHYEQKNNPILSNPLNNELAALRSSLLGILEKINLKSTNKIILRLDVSLKLKKNY
jgi:hypothetical protein